ncbi:hypothetical protein [Bacillus sp. XF8]|uniref:hypothetical protein n=1 Tax=Bacillus sp. XF8 TaxID=2819289 RepID=UPI001AA01135|nr:hypothetical protein [Bacillus sp. XF8]MBO1579974.1 hypothetical protein [Bacillus sp. XF8]
MREHIEKARTIQEGVTSQYLELQKALQEELEEVKRDLTLSEIGRAQKSEQLQKEHGKKLMEFAKQAKNDFQTAVTKARVSAERFLLENADKESNTKPSDTKVKLFEQGLSDLKIRTMLSPNSTRALELINQFVGSIDEAYFANHLRNQFAELIQCAGESGGATVKAELLKIYLKLETDFITDEQNEARQIIDKANVMFGASLFNSIVVDSVREFYRHNFADYINRPDMYVYAEGTK